MTSPCSGGSHANTCLEVAWQQSRGVASWGWKAAVAAAAAAAAAVAAAVWLQNEYSS